MTTKQPLGPMPMSDAAIQGGTAGALGGASEADLRRGFSNGEEEPKTDPAQLYSPVPESSGGFLNRPHGWER
jgi:hypothetical protein